MFANLSQEHYIGIYYIEYKVFFFSDKEPVAPSLECKLMIWVLAMFAYDHAASVKRLVWCTLDEKT